MEEGYVKELQELVKTGCHIITTAYCDIKKIYEDHHKYAKIFKDATNSLSQAKAEGDLSLHLMIELKMRASELLENQKRFQASTRASSKEIHDLKKKANKALQYCPDDTHTTQRPIAYTYVTLATLGVAACAILYTGFKMISGYVKEEKIHKQFGNLRKVINVATRLEMVLEELRFKNCGLISNINGYIIQVEEHTRYSFSRLTSNISRTVRVANDTIADTSELRYCYEEFIEEAKTESLILQFDITLLDGF